MDILKQWQRIQPLPMGSYIFSALLGRMIPYSGSMGAQIVELEAGKVKIKLPDTRKIRNHLSSIHAVALMNLGELTTGITLYSALPKGFLGILTHLEIDYHKKARGTLSTELSLTADQKLFVDGEIKTIYFSIKNQKGEEVSSGKALWKVGTVKPK